MVCACFNSGFETCCPAPGTQHLERSTRNAEVLDVLPSTRNAEVLDVLPSTRNAEVLDVLPSTRNAEVLDVLPSTRNAEVLGAKHISSYHDWCHFE